MREVFERMAQELGKKFRLGVYDPEKRQLMGVIVKIGLNSTGAIEDLDVPVDDEADIVVYPMDLGG
ncbi:hypothetical protein DRO60_06030 [Candidatus Bathyarchaeota archaeon]|nr:MAG: hypothetical protein DRO60_06030 [Candidatus Bathyarchaeota archaeon]